MRTHHARTHHLQRDEWAKLEALRRASVEGFADVDAGRFVELDVGDLETYVATLARLPTADS